MCDESSKLRSGGYGIVASESLMESAINGGKSSWLCSTGGVLVEDPRSLVVGGVVVEPEDEEDVAGVSCGFVVLSSVRGGVCPSRCLLCCCSSCGLLSSVWSSSSSIVGSSGIVANLSRVVVDRLGLLVRSSGLSSWSSSSMGTS